MDFFVAGGTLPPNDPSYVKRPADDKLFKHSEGGEFCYVLTARQMGKSSLMSRTAKRLEAQDIKSVMIDLTQIGSVKVDEWYQGLLRRLKKQLGLVEDAETWWKTRSALGNVQRFTDFLHDVVLKEVKGQVVIFIDEIDTTLKLDFTDDFFAAIRAMYNARATEPEFERLTFVLIGVASPLDLIKDSNNTPFNIGHRIPLEEFSKSDARVLQDELEAMFLVKGKEIFDYIHDKWTSGHPYLTQKLCQEVAQSGRKSWPSKQIDTLVEELFFSQEGWQDPNLQFVEKFILTHSQRRKLLNLYKEVYQNQDIQDDSKSPIQIQLKLSGLVKVEAGKLQLRNEIYRHVFDMAWIEKNNKTIWTPILLASSGVLVVLLLLGGSLICKPCCPSPTPTITTSQTPTVIVTVSQTSTPTPTASQTPTPTATASQTPTPTLTSNPTPLTPTPSPTPATPTPSPTPVTPTPSPTPVTPTPSPTPVTPTPVTPSLTPSATPVTPSLTPSVTPLTPTPSTTPVTPSLTPSATPVTPSLTPSVTPVTPSLTPSATPVTPSLTPSATPVTPTLTPSSTFVTPTPIPTYTGAPELKEPINGEVVKSENVTFKWDWNGGELVAGHKLAIKGFRDEETLLLGTPSWDQKSLDVNMRQFGNFETEWQWYMVVIDASEAEVEGTRSKTEMFGISLERPPNPPIIPPDDDDDDDPQ